VLKVLIAAVALLIASIGNGTQAQNQNPSTWTGGTSGNIGFCIDLGIWPKSTAARCITMSLKLLKTVFVMTSPSCLIDRTLAVSQIQGGRLDLVLVETRMMGTGFCFDRQDNSMHMLCDQLFESAYNPLYCPTNSNVPSHSLWSSNLSEVLSRYPWMNYDISLLIASTYFRRNNGCRFATRSQALEWGERGVCIFWQSSLSMPQYWLVCLDEYSPWGGRRLYYNLQPPTLRYTPL
jgi:hypothetical protein